MSAEPPKLEGTPGQPFIATAPALEALALLMRGVGARKPFVVLSGDPGTGKSTIAREAVRRLGERVAARTLAASESVPDTLTQTLLGRFGGTARSQASPLAMMERLVEALANCTAGGKVALLVVEDAHRVPPDSLLQLQRVAETADRRQCPLEIVLVGAPELLSRLAEPALQAVAERVSVRAQTVPLSQTDTRHYLLQRPSAEGAANPGMFSRKACRDIHTDTLGVQRAIEALADEAARRAMRAGSTTVSPEHVRAAAQALRARRGAAPPVVIAPRAERLGDPRPGGATGAPEAGKNGEQSAAGPGATPTAAPAEAERTHAQAISTPASGSEARGSDGPRETASSVRPEAPATSSTSRPTSGAPAAAGSDELEFTPSTDPRVKDWVSRFGGSGVSIGVRHAQSRIQTFTDLDAPEPAVPRSRAGPGAPSGAASPSAVRPAKGPSASEATPPAPAIHRQKLPARPARRRNRDSTWQWAAALLVIGGLAVVLGQRSGFGRHPAFDAADTSVRPLAEPIRVAPRSSPSTQVEKPARPVPVPVAADSPARAAGRETRFSVVVGTFLSHDMALAEKDHLARLTSYRVWVSSARVQGVKTYRLLVGRFESTEEAERAAQSLMRRGLIRDASVQPLSSDLAE